MSRSPLPSRRKVLLLLALAVAVIGGAWWYRLPPHDPEHNGERLSGVVRALEFHPSKPEELASYPAKIRAFGPEAIPWLLYTLEHGKHPLDKHGPLPFDHAPDWVRRLVSESWGGVRDAPSVDERTCAAFAIGQLGPDATLAIPVLVENLKGEDRGLADYSAVALQSIGPASWPAVRTALETGRGYTRRTLVATMVGRIGTDANPASEEQVTRVFEVLAKACRDQQINDVAAYALGACRSARPACAAFDAAIPVLIDVLSDSEPDTREAAANALRYFKGKASAAVPRLIELLDEHSSSGRLAAARALGFVDTSEKRSEAALRVMLYDIDPGCGIAAAAALREMGLSPFENHP